MKKARAKISADLFKQILKLPFNVELVSASFEAGNDYLDIVLQGESLPVKETSGKGRVTEINYDPRPTWVVAGMSPLKGKIKE
jgi:hypothetical protein